MSDMFLIKSKKPSGKNDGKSRTTTIGVLWLNRMEDGKPYCRIRLDYVPTDMEGVDITAWPYEPQDGDAAA